MCIQHTTQKERTDEVPIAHAQTKDYILSSEENEERFYFGKYPSKWIMLKYFFFNLGPYYKSYSVSNCQAVLSSAYRSFYPSQNITRRVGLKELPKEQTTNKDGRIW